MRRESPARRLLWLLFSVTGLSARACAEGTTPFSGPLLFRGCESGERQEIGRLVAIDWAGIEESSSSRAGSITVACREGRFDVSVTRPDGRELTRSIDLQQLPPRARPRIIAIAVVELFAASAVETPPSPSPAAVPAPDADFDLQEADDDSMLSVARRGCRQRPDISARSSPSFGRRSSWQRATRLVRIRRAG